MRRAVWSLVLVCASLVVGLAVAGASAQTKPAPRQAPTATPTCTHTVQRTPTVTGASPTPTYTTVPYADCPTFADPYGDNRNIGGAFNVLTVPLWRLDINNDNVALNVPDSGLFTGVGGAVPQRSAYDGCVVFWNGWPRGTCTPTLTAPPGGPTLTPTPTPGGPTNTATNTPTATATEVPTVTPEQAESIIATNQDVVRLMFFAALLLTGILVALVLSMYKGERK